MEIKKFTSIPLTVEARQVPEEPTETEINELYEWTDENIIFVGGGEYLYGVTTAGPTDWIIRYEHDVGVDFAVVDELQMAEEFKEIAASKSDQILDFQLPRNDAGAATVRQYIIRLAAEVVWDGEGFSGKRPFGNSGWFNELANPLVEAGLCTEDSVKSDILNAVSHMGL